METFADKVIRYNSKINFAGSLPEGIRIMNPYRGLENGLALSSDFYKKFYDDINTRYLVLGINPGRFGGGVTGIPFTDTKRLIDKCKIEYTGPITHEPSSVFIYEMIDAFGGVKDFYSKIYINSICPLGFTSIGNTGREVNYNYYDSKELTAAVYDFMIENIRKLLSFGVDTNICFCFGTGKNERFLRSINDRHQFFGEIVPLEHPRFIMQYKSKHKQFYIEKYLKAFMRTCQ